MKSAEYKPPHGGRPKADRVRTFTLKPLWKPDPPTSEQIARRDAWRERAANNSDNANLSMKRRRELREQQNGD